MCIHVLSMTMGKATVVVAEGRLPFTTDSTIPVKRMPAMMAKPFRTPPAYLMTRPTQMPPNAASATRGG